MRLRSKTRWAVLLGMPLLLAGCGGPQNPVAIRAHGNLFFNGLWDGFTVFLGLLWELLSSDRYGIYNRAVNSTAYDLGYFIGFLLFALLLVEGASVVIWRQTTVFRYRRAP